MEQFSLEKYLKNPRRKVVNGWGEKVRILCTDLHGFGEEKIAAAVEVDKGCEIIRTYDSNGVFCCLENYQHDNLFFAPQKQSRWIFLYGIEDWESFGDTYNGIQRSGLFENKKDAEKKM